MRTVLFILVLLLIIGGGLYLKFGKSIFPAKQQILPQSEWPKILLGKWKYKRAVLSDQRKELDEGEIEFNKDHTFIQYLKMNYYLCYNRNKPCIENSNLTCTGSLNGIWSIKDSTLLLSCACEVNKVYDLYKNKEHFDCCQDYYSITFGNIDNYIKENIEQFNKNILLFKGHNYNTDDDLNIIFERFKN